VENVSKQARKQARKQAATRPAAAITTPLLARPDQPRPADVAVNSTDETSTGARRGVCSENTQMNERPSRGQSHFLGSSYFSFQILKKGGEQPAHGQPTDFSLGWASGNSHSLSTGSRIRHLEPRCLHGWARMLPFMQRKGNAGWKREGVTYQELPKVLLPAVSARL
jgi:hypothetical protein